MTEQEMLAQIEKLQAENAGLKESAKANSVTINTLNTKVTEYETELKERNFNSALQGSLKPEMIEKFNEQFKDADLGVRERVFDFMKENNLGAIPKPNTITEVNPDGEDEPKEMTDEEWLQKL